MCEVNRKSASGARCIGGGEGGGGGVGGRGASCDRAIKCVKQTEKCFRRKMHWRREREKREREREREGRGRGGGKGGGRASLLPVQRSAPGLHTLARLSIARLGSVVSLNGFNQCVNRICFRRKIATFRFVVVDQNGFTERANNEL